MHVCRKLLAAVMHELRRLEFVTDDIALPTHPDGHCSDGCMQAAQHSASWLGVCYVPGAPQQRSLPISSIRLGRGTCAGATASQREPCVSPSTSCIWCLSLVICYAVALAFVNLLRVRPSHLNIQVPYPPHFTCACMPSQPASAVAHCVRTHKARDRALSHTPVSRAPVQNSWIQSYKTRLQSYQKTHPRKASVDAPNTSTRGVGRL